MLISLEQLQGLNLLSGLAQEQLLPLREQMPLRRVERKAVVLHKGAEAQELMFLLSGQLQVVDVSEDGKEVGLYLIQPGEVFGELALIDGEPRSSSVVATQPSEVAVLSKAAALELFYSQPVVMHRLLVRLAKIIRNTNAYRSVLSQNTAWSRVYAVLCKHMKPNVAGMITIENLPTQQELAIMANTSRETVSRAIGDLVSKGVVEKDLRRLLVRKPDVLAQLSHDEG